MEQQTVLDLYCGGGGATRGYQRSGFHVTGVDYFPQPEYCGDAFVQGDAIAYAIAHGHEFDFIHASCPCQGASTITADTARANYPNLIPATRRALLRSRQPFVIENVPPMERIGPMRRDLRLCGEMFGLRVVRHRIFEVGGWLPRQLKHPEHVGTTRGAGRRSRGTYTTEGHYLPVYGNGGGKGDLAEWRMAMGIDWITDRHTLAEAIPPAYTQYIANEFLGVPADLEEIRRGYV